MYKNLYEYASLLKQYVLLGKNIKIVKNIFKLHKLIKSNTSYIQILQYK